MKVALVTGAGKRLGQVFAIHLAERGYDIAVHCHASAAGAADTKRRVEAIGRKAVVIQQNLSELFAGKQIIDRIEDEFGRLDVVVNNASTFPDPDKLQSTHSFLEEREENWEETIAVNARAPFFLIQHAARLLSTGSFVINVLDKTAGELHSSRAAHSLSKAMLGQITIMSAAALSGEATVVSLELDAVIPGEQMSRETIAKIRWSGIEPVLEAVDQILDGEVESGAAISVE